MRLQRTDPALAEVVFHKSVEYQEINRFDDCVGYQAYLADFTNKFQDLCGQKKWMGCLDPRSYVASQDLAAQLLAQGALGIIYPSVRQAGGINLACFRPALVGNVRRGSAWRMGWRGKLEPEIQRLKAI